MGAMVYMCHDFIARMGHETIAVIGSVFLGVCVYAVLAVYLKMFSKEELSYIPGGGKLKKLIYGNK